MVLLVLYDFRSVTDPRDGKRVALKKMPSVFQNLVSCKRVYRELRMLCQFKHDNVRNTYYIYLTFILLSVIQYSMNLIMNNECFD